MSRAGAACVTVLAAGVLAVPATARTSGNFATAEIARAQAAGIKIDPAAKAIMAAAPVGSCLSDPTQATCDTPTAIVADGQPLPDGSMGYAESSIAAPTIADAAVAFPQCFIRATAPYKSVGFGQGDGANQCTARVEIQELCVTLFMFWISTGRWVQQDTGVAGPTNGGKTIRAHAQIRCRTSETRVWQTQAAGYADIDGVWYAGLQRAYANLRCRT
jgi:hypothetical protein